MIPVKKTSAILLALAGLVGLGTITAQENVVPLVNEPLQNPIEIQTRGPLHEAFAQPLEEKPAPGEIVPKEPPPAITELPPEERPDLDNTQWVPGYWAWDADRQDFMWVSGVYRVPPQGRTFVPGYWLQSDDGWRWIPGFWADAQQPEVPYAPEPPAPLSVGPTTPQPDEDATFIPGVWVYNTDRFVWRPGYWAAVQVGRVWCPPRYIWTPNGYLFINGFYDVPYSSRGMVFAPVAFNRPLWRDPNWRYRPDHVVSLSLLFDSAFVRGGSFYFGNFYNAGYAQRGYRPWYNGIGRYDPAFAYNGWQNNRGNPNWIGNVQKTYANRSEGRANVPPSTFAQQRAAKNFTAVTPLNQVAAGTVRTVRATPAQIEAQRTNAERTRELSNRRRESDAVVLKQPITNRGPQGGEGRSFKVPGSTPPSMSQTLTFPTTPKTGKETPRTFEGRQGINDLGTPSKPNSIPRNPDPFPRVNNPGVTQPPLNKKSDSPRNVTNPLPTPTPKQVTPPPSAPKISTPPPQPQRITPPPSQPKFTPPPSAPKISTPPPQPQRITPPPSQPKFTPPPSAPKISTPPPQPQRITPPPSQPKFTPPPSAPKISTPPPQPQRVTPPTQPQRVTPPPSAPKISPPPQKSAPRAVTPPQSTPRVVSPPPSQPRNPPPARPSPPPARPKSGKR